MDAVGRSNFGPGYQEWLDSLTNQAKGMGFMGTDESAQMSDRFAGSAGHDQEAQNRLSQSNNAWQWRQGQIQNAMSGRYPGAPPMWQQTGQAAPWASFAPQQQQQSPLLNGLQGGQQKPQTNQQSPLLNKLGGGFQAQ